MVGAAASRTYNIMTYSNNIQTGSKQDREVALATLSRQRVFKLRTANGDKDLLIKPLEPVFRGASV